MTDVTRTAQLGAEQIQAVLELAAAASNADGAYPLSEDTVLKIRDDAPAHNLFVLADGKLVGYAFVTTDDIIDGPAAELMVHPAHRRRGYGRQLVAAAIDIAEQHDPAGRLRLWAHGDHPSASALALGLGFQRYRSLWLMRRSLPAPFPPPVLPAGVTLRTFRPGQDESDWLELNARAFASHPEQGRWSPQDLEFRLAEPWFDPAGFFLAEHHGKLVGFHWTKVHAERPVPIGEVYVVGVDPDWHGKGLGGALTIVGLRHLQELGLTQVMLYVDEDNAGAIRVYQKLGFARLNIDVGFQRITNP